MPRAFTKEEREAIRGRIVVAGKELFSRYGLQKTTVEELARAARIAKGTFYLFFPSKEALYAEVLLTELPKLIKQLHERSFKATNNVREALVRFQEELVVLIEENELVRAATSDLRELVSLLSAHVDLMEYQRRAWDALSPIVEELRKAQQRGELISGDITEMFSVLGMIKLLPFYRRKIDSKLYRKLVKRVAEVIADGLTCPARREG